MKTAILVGVGIVAGVAALAWLAARRAGPGAFDPTSANNLAHRAASSVTEALTGVQGDTPGTALHRVFNSDYENWDPNAPAAFVGLTIPPLHGGGDEYGPMFGLPVIGPGGAAFGFYPKP
jgi:hypothetical protein